MIYVELHMLLPSPSSLHGLSLDSVHVRTVQQDFYRVHLHLLP